MASQTPSKARTIRRPRRSLESAQAESDLAYCEARLAIIGQPATLNQVGQRRLFKLLRGAMVARLAQTAADPPAPAADEIKPAP